MESFDFYAYWNGPSVADLWSTIASLTSTADYGTLLVCLMIIGFLAVMIGAAVRNRGADAVTWFAATVIIFSIAYLPRVTISVKDVRAGYTQAVSNVPLGIGVPASIISQISWWLTQSFETAFQDVDAASYSRFGMAFPQRAVTTLMAMGPVTEKGRDMLQTVTERCVVPEMLDDPEKRIALLEAPDIYTLVAGDDWLNPARRVVLNNNAVTCTEALPILTQYLAETEIPAMENRLLTHLGTDPNSIAAAAFLAAVPNAETLMLGTSRSLTESLRQSLMLSVIPDAAMSAAAKAGNAPLSAGVALARAQGNLASEINYRTLADMAKSALPKVRNVLEFVVIGLFPVVLLMLAGLGLGGLPALRAYLTLLISVALWAPVTAIINYLIIHVDAEPMNRLVEAAGGVTLSAATLIREGGASSQAMAGSLMWLVPVLAYAVAKGSDMAITSMASSVLSPAAAAAQSQGSAIAMGNVAVGNATLGNASMNTVSGNKTDLSSAYTSPDMHRSTLAEGTWQGNRAEGTVTAMSVADTNLAVTSQGGLSRGIATSAVQQETRGTSLNVGSTYNDATNVSSGSVTQGAYTQTTSAGSTQTYVHDRSSGVSTSMTTNETNTATTGIQTNGTSAESFGVSSALLGSNIQNYDNSSTGTSPTAVDPTSPEFSFAYPTKGEFAPHPSPLTALAGPTKPSGKAAADNNGFDQMLNQRLAINVNGVTSSQLSEGMASSNTSSHANSLAYSTSGSELSRQSNSDNKSENNSASISHSQNSSRIENKSIGNNQSFNKSHSQNDQLQTSDQKQSNVTTGVVMGSTVRDEAIKIFGGPQDVLRNLNNSSAARVAFGRHINNVVLDQIPFTLSKSAPTPMTNPVGGHQNTVNAVYEADQLGVESAYEYSVGRVEQGSQVGQQPEIGMPVSKSDIEQHYLVKGLTIAASAQYQQTETGMLSVASRSYLFGLGYSSPKDLYQTMYAKSQSDPEFRQALIDLGREGNKKTGQPLDTEEIVRRLSR